MLDGVHVDIVGDAVLSAAARVRQTVVRRGYDGVRAQLAGHGGVFGNAVHPDPGAQPDHYSVHVRVHLRCDQAAAAGFSGTRQGKQKNQKTRTQLYAHCAICVMPTENIFKRKVSEHENVLRMFSETLRFEHENVLSIVSR